MNLIKFFTAIVIWLYAVVFMLWVNLIGLIARLLTSPEDIFLIFRLTLLVNQIKEIYESIPGFNFARNFYRRM